MFPIRRPCADAMRTGMSVLWSSSSSSLGGFYSRIFLKQFQISSRTLFSSVISPYDNPQLSVSTSHHQPSPPALNSILRGTSPSTSPHLIKSLSCADKPINLTDHPIKFSAATPKEKREPESDLQQDPQKKSGAGNPDKPSPDQLQKTYKILQTSLERTFTHPMDYTIYHPDILFIDNIRHIRTQGLAKYIQQIAVMKMVGHVKFAYVRFEILQMSMSTEEARITVRWRIKGLSGLRVMLKFWKYKLWRWQEIVNHQETWYDGISYFDVGPDAKIFQHVADKVMEDKDRSVEDKPRNNIPFAAKLGGALGATAATLPSSSASLNYTNHPPPTPQGGGGNPKIESS